MTASTATDCPACQQAERDPTTGLGRIGCRGCAAREVARSREFWAAEATRTMTGEYRALLRRALPNLEIVEAHRLVKAESEKARTARKEAA